MAPSRSRPSWLQRTVLCLTVLTLAAPSQALYFYLEGTIPKCFYEELPKDTLVVGHYKAELYTPSTNTHTHSPDLDILITVDETLDPSSSSAPDSNPQQPGHQQRVISQRGTSNSRFTFTAAESGQHVICFTASGAAVQNAGWLSGGSGTGPNGIGATKLTLDLAIGETSKIESEDKGKMADIVQKVRDLNGRLQDIRREQVFQREREAEFRDQSEATNARVVRWTLIQLGVLGLTCAWQLSHLRAFFIKQKLT